MHFETEINRPAQPIFDLIADLPGYPKWLEPSGIYSAVTPANTAPTKLGTTYTDVGKSATMHGEVTRFEPPKYITFDQKTELKVIGILKGSLQIQIQYSLNQQGNSTQVVREVNYKTAGLFGLLGWLVKNNIRSESTRILQKMKAYLES